MPPRFSMAARELSLFSDLDQGRLVQGFLSTLQATLPRFVFGDSVPVSFRALKPAGGNSATPWAEVDLTGKTVRIAIGSPAGAPSSGTFTLSFGGDTTSAISYAADGATIQTALNAIASISAAGGVVVTRASTGPFRIVFNTAGARGAITADSAALYPSTGAEIRVAVEGDGDKREIVVARLETQPAAYAELTDELPDAAASIVETRTGSVSVGAIVAIELTTIPYAGFYTLEIGGQQTLGIPWNADASAIQSALESLSTVEAGNVVVTGEFPSFSLSFDVLLADIGTVEIDLSGLVVPAGRSGTLNTNTAGMIELLNGSAQAAAKLEIELFDIADATTWTILQTECTVIDDVIGNSPSSEAGGPAYVTTEMLADMTIGDTAPSNDTVQIEFAECIGAVLVGLNVIVTITGGPEDVILNVAVAEGDLPAAWGGKIVTQGASSDDYDFSYSGGLLVSPKVPGPWPEMNVAITDPSGSGITPSPTSETNTEGSLATIAPPFIRVAAGFLYIQESGAWKKSALSTL